ncbi:FAD-binding oxidoreductase [Nocardiopsis sp. FIRDI 009]|uniref:FAD-binding oxidoreductase n=1 Tax=Nocardiopsis sp. FIRDI 009 TaxID=714197 RepID=UPI000E26E79C|nr:FAD-binding oxidoreductase [Nocardiopsis sp. FIRDI 009]
MTQTTQDTNVARALVARVSGPVLSPAEDGYDAERAGLQLLGGHRPAAVVGAADARDVGVAVAVAADHGLRVAVQASGHGVGVPLDGGVLISTRRLAEVRVDPDRHTAWVAAGAPWARVIAAAAEYGLAPLSGSAPGVGAVPYTLTGGVGLLGRTHGYAADHVRRFDVVTADGRSRRVSAEEEPDLFWAVRGGGGSFGVVTGMEIALFPVDRFYGGSLYLDADRAPEILDAWRSWTEAVPEELTSGLTKLVLPDAPGVPGPLRGRHVAQVAVAWAGRPERGPAVVEPLRSAGPVLMDALGELPYAESGGVYAEPDRPHGYRSRNLLVDGLDPAATARLTELTGPGLPFTAVVGLRHLGGALARPPERPNAVGHRDAAYSVTVLTVGGEDGPERRALRDEVASLLADRARGRSLGFSFGPLTDAEVRDAFAAEDFDRLSRIRAGYDPREVILPNHRIPPLG